MHMARPTFAAGCEAITSAKALQTLEGTRQIKENSEAYKTNHKFLKRTWIIVVQTPISTHHNKKAYTDRVAVRET